MLFLELRQSGLQFLLFLFGHVRPTVRGARPTRKGASANSVLIVVGAGNKGKLAASDDDAKEAGSMQTEINGGTPGGEAFWAFSTALYARPGVEAALLDLQDNSGLEVNLVLFCVYAGSRGQALDPSTIGALQNIGEVWGRGIVAPLRSARRRLKPLSSDFGPAAALREDVKRVELAAEKAMQEALAELLSDKAAGGGPEVAQANLVAWLKASGLAITPERASAFRTILDAGF